MKSADSRTSRLPMSSRRSTLAPPQALPARERFLARQSCAGCPTRAAATTPAVPALSMFEPSLLADAHRRQASTGAACQPSCVPAQCHLPGACCCTGSVPRRFRVLRAMRSISASRRRGCCAPTRRCHRPSRGVRHKRQDGSRMFPGRKLLHRPFSAMWVCRVTL